MEIIKLNHSPLDETVEKAVAVLKKGGVILYPTDTLYGLGADAFSDDAFETVCTIKDRDERRPIHAVFTDMQMVAEYAEITDIGRVLAERFLPGPLTLVFKKKEHFNSGIAQSLSTIGVRIPKNDFCLALARTFDKPFTTTSANKSGIESPSTVSEILEQLGDDAEMISLAIDAGALPSGLRSTVVDVRETPVVLREGAISREEIEAAIT